MIENLFMLFLVWGVVEDGLHDAGPRPETNEIRKSNFMVGQKILKIA